MKDNCTSKQINRYLIDFTNMELNVMSLRDFVCVEFNNRVCLSFFLTVSLYVANFTNKSQIVILISGGEKFFTFFARMPLQIMQNVVARKCSTKEYN
jgi:hypothetical protein